MKTDTFLEKTATPISETSPAIPRQFTDGIIRQLIRRFADDPPRPGRHAANSLADSIIFGRQIYAQKWLGKIEGMSPRELICAYLSFAPAEKVEFLKLLGESCTARDVFIIEHYLRVDESVLFSNAIHDRMCETFYPFVLQHARDVAKEKQGISDEEFDAELLRRSSEAMQEYNQVIGEREATRLKERRDRKPSKATVIRNKEICDLRRQDKRHWTQGRLAKQYKVTARAIRGILADEPKWIVLAAAIGREEQLVAPHRKRNT